MSSAATDAVRVAAVSVSAALGGSEWSLLDFAVRAARRGIGLTVVLPKDGPLRARLDAAGVATVIAPADAAFLALTQREMLGAGGLMTLQRGLRAWARGIGVAQRGLPGGIPAVLYSNGFKAHLACALVRGPRRVWHLREYPPERTRILWRVLAGALPHATIANSRAVAEAWRLGGLAPAAVPNGVDLERFAPSPASGWVHEQLGLPREAVLLGMPAAFARWKGQFAVVDAFERAADRVPHAHLVLAGGAIYDTDAERGYAQELVARVQRATALATRIHFLKFQSEPWRLYPELTAVLHFSLRPEPFGRVIVEALACGVPAIAARAGGPLETVEEGVTGWLVPQGDVAALADAMVAALGADLGPMRAACRARAERLYSAERYADDVAAILHGQAGRAR